VDILKACHLFSRAYATLYNGNLIFFAVGFFWGLFEKHGIILSFALVCDIVSLPILARAYSSI